MGVVCASETGAWRFCFSVGGGAPGTALVAKTQSLRRASRADDGRMDGRKTPGGPEAGNSQVRYQTRPFYPRGISLYGGERAVDGAPLLGIQVATETQVEPARRKSGKG